MPLGDDDIAAFAAIAVQEAGFKFDISKRDFLQTRLNRRLTASGCADYPSYLGRLERDTAERQRFVEALTVHTTSFFREEAQYRWLTETGLPDLARRRTAIRFWSAACSSGEEGWSALMTAAGFVAGSSRSFGFSLLGTDVSTAILAQARTAIYADDAMQSVPPDARVAYFMRSRNGDGRNRIVPELRSRASWQAGNLVTGQGLAGIQADVAFLRNVLIYFSRRVQEMVIDRVVRCIRPGGYLLTGHSETGFTHPHLAPVQPSIFRKTGPA